MTANGDGTYSFTISSNYDRLLFNTGNKGKQTVDISIDDSTSYTLTGQTTTNSGGTTCYTVNASSPGNTDPTYYPGQGSEPATTEPATSSTYDRGDVNRDSKININDATTIQKYLVLLTNLDSEQIWLADFDNDGRVSIKDSTKIQYSLLE